MVYDSVKAGGSGAATGRNVFQHEDPASMIRVICGIVHEGLNVKTALKKYMK
jgi:DhnA family fructose-bisphosphate aldolase class Ia